VSPTEPRFEVYFIDFGNKEKLNSEDVRPLDAALSAVPAQARPAGLAYVKVGGWWVASSSLLYAGGSGLSGK
jgi:staphylococcal nuclease domain-containing protein 1